MSDFVYKPMYQQIKSDIIRKIHENILIPGEKIPTEHQLMEQYAVSRITVSKALSDLKKEGIIISYPGKGTFISSSLASPSIVKEHETDNAVGDISSSYRMTEIACILPTMEDQFSTTMVNGVLSAFPENAYLCHIFLSRTPEMENYLLQWCMSRNIAGIVLFPQDRPFFSKEVLAIITSNYPLVLIDRYLPRLDTSYVISDNRRSGELCVQHLYEYGHRNIAVVTTSDDRTFSVKHRLYGIRDAAEQLHMSPSSIHVIDHFNRQKNYSFYHDMFRELIFQKRVTAFIAIENECCSYLYNLFSSMNLSVPNELSLISFDKPSLDNKRTGFFTYINQSEYIIGREAGKLLLQNLSHEDTNIHHRVIDPCLEIHESTGRSSLF